MAELNHAALADGGEPVIFAAAGAAADRLSGGSRLVFVEQLSRFRCASCSYGASCKIAPDRCPMCGSKTWEHEEQHWPGKTSSFSARNLGDCERS